MGAAVTQQLWLCRSLELLGVLSRGLRWSHGQPVHSRGNAGSCHGLPGAVCVFPVQVFNAFGFGARWAVLPLAFDACHAVMVYAASG